MQFHLPLLRKPPLLHNQVIHLQLLNSPLHYLLLNRLLSHQPIHKDILLLPYPMCPIYRLQIYLWIPIWIKYRHNISCMQIYPNPTSPSRQYKHLLICALPLKLFNPQLPIHCTRLPINPPILIPPNTQEIIQNIQQPRHLRKYQYFTPLIQQFRQQFIQQLKLHTHLNYMLPIHKRRPRLHMRKQIRMITYFFQLH